MLQKFGKKVMNNFGLKVLAVLFSVVLWIVVVNIDDPSTSKPYTTSVSLENKSYITSMGKWADYLDGKNTITFSVYAKRSVHNTLTNANFTATADAQKIEYDEKTGTYRVPVAVTCNRNSSNIDITSKDLYLDLELEDSASKQFPIKTNTTGTVTSGCALGDVEITDANVMKVSGPASVVNQIDTVVATINVDGMTTDITDRVTPVFYDAQGEIVDTTKLTLSVSTVNISAQILNTKDVELEFLTTGTPAEGYQTGDITYTPQKVRIKGEAAILNTINKITIPEEVLDLTDASSDIEKTVDISTYLPSGTALVISSDSKIDVTVVVEAVKTKTLQIPVTNLQVIGLDSDEKVQYEEDNIALTVSGRSSVIDALDEKTISGSIDLTDLKLGAHNVLITFELDTNTVSYADTYAAVTIESASDTSASADNTDGELENTSTSKKLIDR
ncbi:CdaR family protein [bacterium]|nr:CdaR family protein [bacterium]